MLSKIIDSCAFNLILFAELFLSDYFWKVKSAAFHHEIGNSLIKKTESPLTFIIPRGHGASMLIKAAIIHDVCYNIVNIALLNNSFGASRKSLNSIKQCLELKQIQMFFGIKSNQLIVGGSHFEINLNNGSNIFISSSPQALKSFSKNQRFDKIYLDSIESVNKPDMRQEICNIVYPSLIPNGGRLMSGGTITQKDSYLGQIYEKHSSSQLACGHEVIAYKATQPNMEGGVLWNDLFSAEYLKKKKQLYADCGNLKAYYREFEHNMEPKNG